MPDAPTSTDRPDRSDSTDILVVVGNPQAPSRTSAVATAVGERLAAQVGGSARVLELASLGPALLSWGDPAVDAARADVARVRGLVVASPTYKATYTGLTKLFLDRFDAGELAGLPTVALMTGGSPAHSLAVSVHLNPVLTEIGASCPANGLYVCGPAIDEPTDTIDTWWGGAAEPLRRALGA